MTTKSASRQIPAPAASTAELFLAWLAMPELGTAVHGPASAAPPPAPARPRRRLKRSPQPAPRR